MNLFRLRHTLASTSRLGMLAAASLMAALTALGAFIRLPLPAPLSPITLQFLFCLLAGLLLGPRWGATSQALYVLLGLIGLPVFTEGGGLPYVLKPSFGFLLALTPVALAVGLLTRGNVTRRRVLAALLSGLGVLYLIGLPYLALICRLYLHNPLSAEGLFWMSFASYLPGDALKILLLWSLFRPERENQRTQNK